MFGSIFDSDGLPGSVKRYMIQEWPGEKWDPNKLWYQQDGVFEHLAYMEKQYKEGNVLLMGPLENFTMAFIICSEKVETYQQALEILNGDPGVQNELFTGVVYAWGTNPLDAPQESLTFKLPDPEDA
jgi:uncharacterized protein YciI